MNREFDTDHFQTFGEEIANSVSHGFGLVAALIAAPFLIMQAVQLGSGQALVGVSVFVSSVILLYLASTLYHALPPGNAKRAFRVIEHIAIFLLIAGTYTPFALGILRGPWGWMLFGIVWSLAVVGAILKLRGGLHPILSSIFYLCMGWVALIAFRPLYLSMPLQGMVWIVTGGLAYTVGVIFYAMHARYAHFIWHMFVLAGTTSHFFAIWRYAIRAAASP